MLGWHSSGVVVGQADWLICAIHKTFRTFGEAGKFISEAIGQAMNTYLKIAEVSGYSGHRQCGVVPNSMQLNVHNGEGYITESKTCFALDPALKACIAFCNVFCSDGSSTKKHGLVSAVYF